MRLRSTHKTSAKKRGKTYVLPAFKAQREGFEPPCGPPQNDFEFLKLLFPAVRQSEFSVHFIPPKTQSFQSFPPFSLGITGLSGFVSYEGKITFLERTAERTERTTSKRQYTGRFEHRQIIFEVYCYKPHQLGQSPRRADHGAVLQALPRQQKDCPVSPAQR